MSLTLEKIFEAKNRIAPYTTRTPLIRLEKLDEYLGCQVYLKAECMQITGAFKLRGAVNKIRMLTPEQLSCGIIRRNACHGGGNVVLIQLEHLRVRPCIGGIQCHIDGDITDDADALFVGVSL